MPNEAITCSHCARALKVPSNLLGRKVKCPACGKVFLAKVAEAGLDDVEIVDEPDSPEPEVRVSARPRRRRRAEIDDYDDDLDEDDDDEDYTPRPRRRRRSRKQATAAVFGPAIGLIVVGSIGMLAAILMLVGQMSRVQSAPNPNAAAPENSAAYQTGGWAAVIFSGCWSLAVLVGGFKMKDAESLRDARVAAIVALVPCSVAWALGLPIGIWALFVLARPEVKRGFLK